MQELDAWLSQLPAAMQKDWGKCTPADILEYMESHWLAVHGGTVLPDGSLMPHEVGQCLPIRMVCRLHPHWEGCELAQLQADQPGKPHPAKATRCRAWRSGYLEGSSMPMSDTKVSSQTQES